MKFKAFTLAATTGLAVLAAPLHAAEVAGEATQVISTVKGSLDNRTRVILTGDEVLRNEVLRTGRRASTIIVFEDDTQLELGPGSVLKLDKFVYNPETKKGSFFINLKSGFMRMVSGLLPSSSYKITTPVATIGIRGTVISLWQEPDGDLNLSVDEGETDIESRETGERVSLRAKDTPPNDGDTKEKVDFVSFDNRSGSFTESEQPEEFKELKEVIQKPETAPEKVTRVVVARLDIGALEEACASNSAECRSQAQIINEELNQPFISSELRDEALTEAAKSVVESSENPATVATVLGSLAGSFSSEEQKQKVQEIVEEIIETGEVPNSETVEEVIETVTPTPNTGSQASPN